MSYAVVDGKKTMTINGPWDFTNPHPSDPSLLYHGAPWIMGRDSCAKCGYLKGKPPQVKT